SAMHIRRPIGAGVGLEVDAIGHAGDQVAALGIELDGDVAQHDRDRPNQRLDVGAVLEGEYHAAVALGHLAGDVELKDERAVHVGVDLVAEGEREADAVDTGHGDDRDAVADVGAGGTAKHAGTGRAARGSAAAAEAELRLAHGIDLAANDDVIAGA